MFYHKKGLPESGEIVLCTVKKVASHSVFVILDEYHDNLEGLINLPEIAPGRIRNVRDYVSEGKVVVCKVLDARDKFHIILSLRRVTLNVKLNKQSDYKQAIKAEKMMEIIGKQFKLTIEEMYNKFGYKAIEQFGSVNSFFQEVLTNKKLLEDFNLDPELTKKLFSLIQDKYTIPEVEVKGTLTVQSYDPDGLSIIKKSLLKIIQDKVTLSYLGAPKYKIIVKSKDFKTAEGILKNSIDELTKGLGNKGKVEFLKEE
ncbi:MAG: translation initiation factor IF-2 subunit alpha [Candidatus Nanoarchaeia archaeon]